MQLKTILSSHEIVISKVLRESILAELHEGHFGIVKMKALARGYVWWPNIDKDIENLVANCSKCQKRRNNVHITEKHIWEPATEPFERVHIDFAGPTLNKIFFILVDAFTKWPEVYIVKNMISHTVINVCIEIFARFGIPKILVSDNGRSFISKKFTDFLKQNGIRQRFIAPFHPATNGQAERYVQTIKNGIYKISNINNIEIELNKILARYRIMPHSTTGITPSELMF